MRRQGHLGPVKWPQRDVIMSLTAAACSTIATTMATTIEYIQFID